MESKTDHDYNFNVETADAVAELSQLVLREQQVTRELSALERDIYLTEGEYLAETAPDGNIVRGWEVRKLGFEQTKPSNPLLIGIAEKPGAGGGARQKVQEVQARREGFLQVQRHCCHGCQWGI